MGSGSSGASMTVGSGISVNIRGRQRTYWLAAGGKLRDLQTAQALPGNGREIARKLIANGGTVLTKSQVEKMRKERQEERANTPDYELGNPFNERGRKKRVYRERRRN